MPSARMISALTRHTVPLELENADAASDLGRDLRAIAKDFQRFHRKRKDNVSLGQKIQAPAAEKLSKRINDNDVGV